MPTPIDHLVHPDVPGKRLAVFSVANRDAHLRRGWKPEGASIADDTVAGVKNTVGDDPIKAAEALAAEQARPKPRTSLIDHLTAIVGDTDPEPEG